jgi:hypothetical protein
MILRTRVIPPPTFRPDHQAGRVLAYVDSQLERRRESTRRTGAQLDLEGVAGPRWNLRYTGRGRVVFESQPPPGGLTVEVSVRQEVLWTAAAAPGALLLIWWNNDPLTVETFLWAATWVVVTAGMWLACGVYKVGVLRRLVQQGIDHVAEVAA